MWCGSKNSTFTSACDYSCELLCCIGEVQKEKCYLFFAIVMGHVISTGLELVATSSSTRLNERLASAVKRTVELANSQNISPREKQHVRAIELFSHG